MDFSNLIESVSIEIGGGTGYWCHGCNHLYEQKPKKCKRMITSSSQQKLSQLIHRLGTIDETNVKRYVDAIIEKNDGMVECKLSCPEIDKIFQDEKECQTYEEALTSQ